MIPLEAGSPYIPIGKAPKKSNGELLLLLTLSLIITTYYAVKHKSDSVPKKECY